MSKKEKIYEYKKIKSKGAFHYLFRAQGKANWIHHNTEGPAIEPFEGTKGVSKEYYIFGFKKTIEEFQDFKSSKEGLPWYKNPSLKAVARF
tara:strand:- start:111 stop:383 length:273 start_codon:yes stop_codon:yes gene_type:complete